MKKLIKLLTKSKRDKMQFEAIRLEVEAYQRAKV